MNYSSDNYLQKEPSYGNYWQQQPMKTFNGQPHWATQKEVSILEWKVNRLEKEMNSEYQNNKGDACGRCPQNQDVCLKLSTEDEKSHCLRMHEQCKTYC